MLNSVPSFAATIAVLMMGTCAVRCGIDISSVILFVDSGMVARRSFIYSVNPIVANDAERYGLTSSNVAFDVDDDIESSNDSATPSANHFA